MYLSDVFEMWLYEQRVSIKQSTHSNYKSKLKLYLIPLFGNLNIYNLNIKEINQIWKQWVRGKGSKLSDKYIHDIITVFKAVLKYTSVQFNISIKTEELFSVSIEKREITVFSEYEQRTLLNLLLKKCEPTSLGIIMCMYTGMRLGEICALKWGDIHINDEYIDVNKTLYRTQNINSISVHGKIPKTIIVIDKPKTNSSIRKIPVCNYLNKLLFDTGTHSESNYFLTDSGKYIEPRAYQYIFKKLLIEAGITPAKFHTIRHTFATNCINAGCDVKSLSEILGHSSVKITLERYVHPSMKTRKMQLDKLEVYDF